MLEQNNFFQPKNYEQLTCNFLLNHDLKLFPHVQPSKQIILWLYNIKKQSSIRSVAGEKPPECGLASSPPHSVKPQGMSNLLY